jgi:hypothetical protein
VNAALSTGDLGAGFIGAIIMFVILSLVLAWEMNKWKGITINNVEYEEKNSRAIITMIIVGIICYLIIQLLLGLFFALILTVYLMASIYTSFLKSVQAKTMK